MPFRLWDNDDLGVCVLQGSLGRGLLLYGQHKQQCLAELLAGPRATEGTRFAVAQASACLDKHSHACKQGDGVHAQRTYAQQCTLADSCILCPKTC